MYTAALGFAQRADVQIQAAKVSRERVPVDSQYGSGFTLESISRREQGLQTDATIARSLSRYGLQWFNVPTLVVSVENDLFNSDKGERYAAAHICGARLSVTNWRPLMS